MQDRREGRGRYTWPSGATFTGSFREDKRDGHGIYVSAQEETFEVRKIFAQYRIMTIVMILRI